MRDRHSNKIQAWQTQEEEEMDFGGKHLQECGGKGVINTEKGSGGKFHGGDVI